MGIKHQVMRQERALFCSLLVQSKNQHGCSLKRLKSKHFFIIFFGVNVEMKSADGHICAFFNIFRPFDIFPSFPLYENNEALVTQSKIGNG